MIQSPNGQPGSDGRRADAGKTASGNGQAQCCNESPLPRRNKLHMKIAMIGVGALALFAFMAVIPMLIMGADRDVLIKIPSNATARMVTDSVKAYLGEDYGAKVGQLLKIRHVDFTKRHGAYEIKSGDTPYEAMRKLTRGSRKPVRVTINGFRSLPLLAERIAAKTDFTADSLLAVLNDPRVLSTYGITSDEALGLFLNDTYEIYWSSSPEDVVKKIGANYIKFWNSDRKALAAELELTPMQAVIIASIVDEETNAVEEKGRVGRLYVNRLNRNMKLQADPTVRYALGDFTIKRVTGPMLKTDSPYNTYVYPGLPPGPIRTTSKNTIMALLESAPSEDIYMCAKEDFSGRHNFASTYEEHQANARRYQQELDRRGIH